MRGGGFFNFDGLAVFDSCTIEGNTAPAGSGGGLPSLGDSATLNEVRNSIAGGGLYNANGLTTLDSCTIAGNTAPAGQGSGVASVENAATSTRARNCVLAGNANTDVDFVSGAVNSFQSNGYNLLGDGNAVPAFTATNDVTGNTNPGLFPLAENGGRTQTRRLTDASPARETGSAALVADQRGVPRPLGPADDKGAFEFNSFLQPLVVTTLVDEDNGSSDWSSPEKVDAASAAVCMVSLARVGGFGSKSRGRLNLRCGAVRGLAAEGAVAAFAVVYCPTS